jgi:phospholipase C
MKNRTLGYVRVLWMCILLCAACRPDTGSAAQKKIAASLNKKSPHAAKRAACGYRAGTTAAETLEPEMPKGNEIPIDHFIVVMQENRSFDHYFQHLKEQGQKDVDVAPPGYKNPTGNKGQFAEPFLLKSPCLADVPHLWTAVHRQYANGRMNGFASQPKLVDGIRTMGTYDKTTINYYYALASTFALADHYHADVPGPTWPNRMYFLSGSSFGHVDNTAPPAQAEERSIFHELEKAGLSWTIYAESAFFEKQIYPKLVEEQGKHFKTMNDYYADARAGTLPNFAWVESTIGGTKATDEHPPANVQLGQRFVANVAAALFASPNWQKSALFWTYDEHGGFFDHVKPPSACVPDNIAPYTKKGKVNGRFNMLGFRVPFVAISPYSKPHFVSHQTYSHSSVLRLIETRFNLPALSKRDANATPPFDLFDFAKPAFRTPPKLPEPALDDEYVDRCAKENGEYVDPDDAGGNNPVAVTLEPSISY